MTPRKRYRSDLTEAQWQRIKGLLPKARATGRPRCDEREAINGILGIFAQTAVLVYSKSYPVKSCWTGIWVN
jgi:transposase